MKVVVTFAVDTEFAPWRRLREFRRASDRSLYQARIGSADVLALLTGMGAEPAARVVRAALGERPDLVISSGLAGGLKSAYRVGDILAARAVAQGRMGPSVRSDADLLDAAIRCGAQRVETFLTVDELVCSACHKGAMGAEADAVEMESYIVLREAAQAGVPAVAIRAVSDPVEMSLPYEIERDDAGRVKLGRLLAAIAVRPARLPALLRLGRNCRRAAAGLAQFLDAYVGTLAEQGALEKFESEVAAT